MRPILFATALVAPVLAFAGPASAQIQTLPETSRAEAQSTGINRSLQGQQQTRGIVQQQQFETNQIRTQIQTQPAMPPAGGLYGGTPAGVPPVTR